MRLQIHAARVEEDALADEREIRSRRARAWRPVAQMRDSRNPTRVARRHGEECVRAEPLERPLEVTGPVKVKLWVSTDAPDTDFSAKLVDVAPDGKAWNLTDGIVRLKYRNGFKPERPLKGETVLCEIDLWATSNVFLPGHRIRLEISSSNFPRFDRNPNTGETTVRSDVMRRARQRVFHTGEFPSHVLLPVIPDA